MTVKRRVVWDESEKPKPKKGGDTERKQKRTQIEIGQTKIEGRPQLKGMMLVGGGGLHFTQRGQ